MRVSASSCSTEYDNIYKRLSYITTNNIFNPITILRLELEITIEYKCHRMVSLMTYLTSQLFTESLMTVPCSFYLNFPWFYNGVLMNSYYMLDQMM